MKKIQIIRIIVEICLLSFIIFFSYQKLSITNKNIIIYDRNEVDKYIDNNNVLYLHNQNNDNKKLNVILKLNDDRKEIFKNNIIYFNNKYIKINNDLNYIIIDQIFFNPYETKKIYSNVINNKNINILDFLDYEYV